MSVNNRMDHVTHSQGFPTYAVMLLHGLHTLVSQQSIGKKTRHKYSNCLPRYGGLGKGNGSCTSPVGYLPVW